MDTQVRDERSWGDYPWLLSIWKKVPKEVWPKGKGLEVLASNYCGLPEMSLRCFAALKSASQDASRESSASLEDRAPI